MFRAHLIGIRSVLLAGLLATTAPLFAQSTDQGLGQAFPQAKNLSLAPGWKVYRFARDGVAYIQINRADGQLLAVVATANGHFLTLPMGSEAAWVSTPEQPQAATQAPAIKIYDDGSTTIVARVATTGITQFAATSRQVAVACGSCTNLQQL